MRADREKKPPPELYVVIFPCGAYRCCRTRDGAVQEGRRIADGRTCCERGHGSFEVHTYRSYPAGRSCTACYSPGAARLRLV